MEWITPGPEQEVRKWRKRRCINQKGSFPMTDIKAFTPSYEKNCEQINMWEIMSNKYRRRWMEERDQDFLARNSNGSNGWCSRRVVLRNNKREETNSFPIIQLKRFANVLGKVDTNLGLPHTMEEDEADAEDI